MNPAQLAAQLRFALADLSGRNGHHEFEELARQLVRQTICSNVLPATGPVSSGGDQGRDFETFRTFLQTGLPGATGFLGRATDESVVFVCTLQQSGLSSKIKADVEAVVSQGAHVDRIYAITAHDLPVGARHALQEEVLERFGIPLEVLDGRALAERLSDPDTFWIAQHYLDIPAEVLPERRDADDGALPAWYRDALEHWHNADLFPDVYADFSVLKEAMRETISNASARNDLTFWIGKMRSLTDDDAPTSLRMRALYEIAVCHFRTTRDMAPIRNEVGQFFELVADLEDPALLRDAVVLLTYSVTAHRFGLAAFTEDELAAWHERVRGQTLSLLETTTRPTVRLMMLENIGLLGLQPAVRPAGNPRRFRPRSYERCGPPRQPSWSRQRAPRRRRTSPTGTTHSMPLQHSPRSCLASACFRSTCSPRH